MRQQNIEKAQWDIQIQAQKADKEAAGEEFVPVEREWEEIKEPEIQHKLKKFVVCIDSMGQDREFTEAQKEIVLSSILRFRLHWESYEKTKLIEDRDALIEEKEDDSEKFSLDKMSEVKSKEDFLVDQILNPEGDEESKEEDVKPKGKGAKKDAKPDKSSKEPKPTEIVPDLNEIEEYEGKQLQISQVRMKYIVELMCTDPDFKARFSVLREKKIIKYHLLIKSLFYLMEFDRQLICVPETQQFNWKLAKHCWNEKLIQKMKEFQIEGSKTTPVKAYHTINFIEGLMDSLTEENLRGYNQAMALIYNWLKVAIQARKKNIMTRLNKAKIAREERNTKIEEEKARKEDRAARCLEEKEKFEADNQEEIQKFHEYQAALDTDEPL